MASYGTKEYWEDVRDQTAIVLDSLITTGFDHDAPYKKVDDFCKIFRDNYSDYVNAVKHINELESTNVNNSDA